MHDVRPQQFRLVPIDSAVAERLRSTDGARFVADSKPGYPCRSCLRDAEIGEEVVLVAHDPFSIDSPYRSFSPIFLHTRPCAPELHSTTIPDQLTIRRLSVRAFDAQAMMLDAALIDGSDLSTTIDYFFAGADVDEIHVHNAVRGCWAVTVIRA